MVKELVRQALDQAYNRQAKMHMLPLPMKKTRTA